METKEFEILGKDTLDAVETMLGRLAVDGIDTAGASGELRISFLDGSDMLITRNDEFQRITINADQGVTHYYFNETEESWLSVGSDGRFVSDLESLISGKMGKRVRLSEE